MSSGEQRDDWQALMPDTVFETLRPAQAKTSGDGGAAPADLGRALEQAGADGLAARAASKGMPLTVVVNDGHRFTATRPFLDALFALLDRSLTAEEFPAMRLLVAAGTHRASPGERSEHERRQLGPHRARFAELAWHDAYDGSSLAELAGLKFHHWMAEGGFYLACGSMEPHYFAGVTGAHKTLTVGVMGAASIEANHSHAMSPEVAGLKLEGNPVHEGIVEALAVLEAGGASLAALNQLIVGGVIAQATAGHPLEALSQGLALVRRSFSVSVAERAELLVARVAAPLDRDLYQADKGIKNTEAAVADGGVLIVDAPCAHGLGIDHFVELLRQAPSYREARAVVERRGYRLGDHKAVRLRALTDQRGVRVGVLSPGIDPAMEEVLAMRVFHHLKDAASWAAGLLGPKTTRGLIVEDAGNLTLELL